MGNHQTSLREVKGLKTRETFHVHRLKDSNIVDMSVILKFISKVSAMPIEFPAGFLLLYEWTCIS